MNSLSESPNARLFALANPKFSPLNIGLNRPLRRTLEGSPEASHSRLPSDDKLSTTMTSNGIDGELAARLSKQPGKKSIPFQFTITTDRESRRIVITGPSVSAILGYTRLK
jgi:hypothetical protein